MSNRSLKELRLMRFPYSESGSAAFLCMVIALPLLFFLMALTVELNSYFGARDELQSIADAAVLQGVRLRTNGDAIERRITERAAALEALVQLDSVEGVIDRGTAEVSITARYEPTALKMLTALLGATQVEIPMQIEARSRRNRRVAAILFDRTVQDTSHLCSDASFEQVKRFVATVASGYRTAGAQEVAVGVMPGVLVDVSLLSDDSFVDRVPRCGNNALSGGQDIDVAGAIETLADPYSIGFAVSDAVEEMAGNRDGNGNDIEQLDVVIIVRDPSVASGIVTSVASALDGVAGRLNRSVHVKIVDVTGQEQSNPETRSFSGQFGLQGEIVHIKKMQQLSDARLVTALVASSSVDVIAR